MGLFSRNSNADGATVVTTTTTTTTPKHGRHNAAGYPNTRAGRGAKPSLMSRLKGNSTSHTATTQPAVKKSRFGRGTGATTTTGTARKHKAAVPNGYTKNGVPKRKVGLGDKISGLGLKMKGSATHRPGEKAAGTRRMHGTDGKGSTRAFY